jgi:hypothetical protein
LANRRAAVWSPDAACFRVERHAPPQRAQTSHALYEEHRERGTDRYTAGLVSGLENL